MYRMKSKMEEYFEELKISNESLKKVIDELSNKYMKS